MGFVYSEIKMINFNDKMKSQIGAIKEQEVRSMTVTAMVDTGAGTLVINEAVREKLGLEKKGTRSGILADGVRGFYDMAGPLEIWWKDRDFVLYAMVIPNADEILLGAMALEGLDLIVDPLGENLVGAHGDEIAFRV